MTEQYFVTLNGDRRIREACDHQPGFAYEHPVFNVESVAAQSRQSEINGVRQTYYCGAYWRNGFHEDGVVSALNALADFEQRNETCTVASSAGKLNTAAQFRSGTRSSTACS